MPGRTTRKYSVEQNVNFGMRALGVLADETEALEISQIQSKDMMLKNLTNQKMARVLSELCEMGLVLKSKSRATNRMTYKARAVCEAQGYDVESMVY
jgi:hypothetical protein